MPAHKTKSQKDDVMSSEVVGERLTDCSDSQYRCVNSWTRTYAIPRKRLSPTSAYVKDGVTFRVESCLRGDEAVCQVALIGGYCLAAPDYGCSQGLPEGQSPKWGYVTYFLYNEDFGITAMGVTNGPPAEVSEKMVIASQSILQGSRGLLRE
jgi:hypothetical protein